MSAHLERLVWLYIYYTITASTMLLIRLPGATAEMFWNSRTFPSFTLHQTSSAPATGMFLPVILPLLPDCSLDMTELTRRIKEVEDTGLYPCIAVAIWQDAVNSGCFSVTQIMLLLRRLDGPDISGLVVSSAVDSDSHPFGSPVVEPFTDLSSLDSGMTHHLTLVATSAAKALVADIAEYKDSIGAGNITTSHLVRLVAEQSPWDTLVNSPAFAAQKYMFMCLSISLILYVFWKIGLMLCTMAIWNQRMLMYISAIGYLVVFTLLHPNTTNNRAAQMAIFASWIVGYISFTLFVVSWGNTVQSIHGQVPVLRHHHRVHYASAIIASVSILLRLWAYAAASFQFSEVAGQVVIYALPAVFGTQTALLGILIWSFLNRTFSIAISRHTKSVLRNVAVLCLLALLGCLFMVALGVTLASPARYTLHGYAVIVVFYQLGQCLLLLSIFAALWVRDHAKRTRPQYNEHEFYVTDTAASGSSCSELTNATFSPSIQSQSVLPSTTTTQSMSPATISSQMPIQNDYIANNLLRKHSKRHVYIPLESASRHHRNNSITYT